MSLLRKFYVQSSTVRGRVLSVEDEGKFILRFSNKTVYSRIHLNETEKTTPIMEGKGGYVLSEIG